ncbi:MAG: hypothetical protein V4727_00610 [Verrucomicrobiota bacterium]
MKTSNQLKAIKVASLVVTAFAATAGNSFAAPGNGNSGNSGNAAMIPTVPGGWLSAYPTMVKTGTHPTLSWAITYPSNIANYSTITPPAKLTANGSSSGQLDVDIRVIGAGVTVGEPSGTNTNWVPTQALVSVGGGTYKSVFLGTNTQVDPNALVWSKRVNSNTTFEFGGRYYFDGGWSTTYNSQNGNNIRILKNGEYPPTAYALHTSDQLKSFMAPYLDGGGKIKIGPLDAIIMMELTQPESNTNDTGYNLQDMVLLMTVKPKGNNGHGNNIDGVDASNPGNAPFMKYDTNAAIDDERK